MAADFCDVDPRELRVPPSRGQGADPFKLARQISLFGAAAAGWVGGPLDRAVSTRYPDSVGLGCPYEAVQVDRMESAED